MVQFIPNEEPRARIAAAVVLIHLNNEFIEVLRNIGTTSITRCRSQGIKIFIEDLVSFVEGSLDLWFD